jgi:hypothetical protein
VISGFGPALKGYQLIRPLMSVKNMPGLLCWLMGRLHWGSGRIPDNTNGWRNRVVGNGGQISTVGDGTGVTVSGGCWVATGAEGVLSAVALAASAVTEQKVTY